MAKQFDTIIVGLGVTGLSCARYLARRDVSFAMVDTRANPSGLAQLQQELPEVQFISGEFDEAVLSSAKRLILSPGVALTEPAIAAAIDAGVEISSDIDLFCEAAEAPIAAITGSNAKSTVTTLVGLMVEQAGKRVGVGGNIGTPVLALLEQVPHDFYVLELSSFQLEITRKLRAEVAVVLNVSADHMDRYDSLESYRAAKHNIFHGCCHIVNNLDDPQLPAVRPATTGITHFGVLPPASNEDFGVITKQGQPCLALGKEALIPVAELKIKGRHNVSNALAALALGHVVGLPMAPMLEALKNFNGLPHRCQWVREHQGVTYYNDSKGTNVGATLAALQGLGEAIDGRLVLIAGGVGKGADFLTLAVPVVQYCRGVVLIGEAADELALVFQVGLGDQVLRAESMAQAVQRASEIAEPGDAVLLSPACASFDMYSGFGERGDDFMAEVNKL